MAVAYQSRTGHSTPVKIFDATTDGGPCSEFLVDYTGAAAGATGVEVEAKGYIRGTLTTISKVAYPDAVKKIVVKGHPNKIIQVWIQALGGDGAVYGAGVIAKDVNY